MKSVVIATAALGVLAVHAHPALDVRAPPGPSPSDRTILNFALTLEHLENAFYKWGLQRWSQSDFDRAGLPEGARQQFIEIGENESAHVDFLTGLLGPGATRACTYKFPVNDPKAFAMLSQVFENVGVGAYTGATSMLSKQYITGSASILGTEGRQAALIAAYINGVEGWGGPWNSPLTMSQAYTLASPFIVRCPSTNPRLPVQVFPSLIFPPNPSPGSTVPVKFKTRLPPGTKLWAAFLTGNSLEQEVVPVRGGRVTIPKDVKGQVYAIITTSEEGATDRTTVAGPAILQFEFTLEGKFMDD
ncbi:ferritin-like domain-containing protein [Lyophyllum atratum]|nr:ferritin-like domain-containing protein [Lyophyllum atratum]